MNWIVYGALLVLIGGAWLFCWALAWAREPRPVALPAPSWEQTMTAGIVHAGMCPRPMPDGYCLLETGHDGVCVVVPMSGARG